MIELYHADFTSMTVPDHLLESVDIIVTDPPYAKEHLWLYGSLAAFANQVLKPKGCLLTLVPHRHIHTVINEMELFLAYRWLMCMYQGAPPHAQFRWMGISIRWKPIIWMVKDKMPRMPGFRPDAFENPAPAKDKHKWQQSEDWAEFCLKFIPPDGKVVCDPMMGTGTVGVVCKRLGLDFIGIDNDEKMFNIAKERIDSENIS